MSYIGRQLNNLSDRVKLDSITASATATYNLLLNTVAYVPSSAESLTVSLNGVIQAPQDSYTVSGSQITFASALTSSDSIDFILAERSITLQTPSAGSVGTTQLAADAVNGDKIADDSISDEHLDITAITGQTEKTSLADADKFLISDSAASGALKYVQKSNLPSGGLVYVGGGSTTSNVAAITIDNVFTSTYENYMVIGDMTSNGNSNPVFNFRSTAPATITSSNYKYSFDGCTQAGSAATNAQSANSEFEFATQLYNSNQIDFPSCWFQFFINSPNSSTHNTTFTGNYGAWKENGNLEGYAGAGMMTLQTACGGIRFATSANSVNNANIKVYGIVNS